MLKLVVVSTNNMKGRFHKSMIQGRNIHTAPCSKGTRTNSRPCKLTTADVWSESILVGKFTTWKTSNFSQSLSTKMPRPYMTFCYYSQRHTKISVKKRVVYLFEGGNSPWIVYMFWHTSYNKTSNWIWLDSHLDLL